MNYRLFDFLDTNKDLAQSPINIFFSILNKQKKIFGYCGLVNIDWNPEMQKFLYYYLKIGKKGRNLEKFWIY